MLQGVNEEAFKNELASVTIKNYDLLIQRKKGLLSKIRNTIIQIRLLPQRNEAFKQLQKDYPLINQISELYAPNDTRQNSMFKAIIVFIRLKLAVEDFYNKAHSNQHTYQAKITNNGSKPAPLKHRKKLAYLDDYLTQDDQAILAMYN